MSEIRDRIKSRMGYLMLEEISMPIGMPEKIVEKLLSIPELAIVDREAHREFYDEGHQVEVEIPNGWVKEVK